MTPPGWEKNGVLFRIQALPEPSMARLTGAPTNEVPLGLELTQTVKSFGCAVSAGANGGVAVDRAYSAATLAAGLCARLIAAVAVSVGCAPVVPPDSALVNRV